MFSAISTLFRPPPFFLFLRLSFVGLTLISVVHGQHSVTVQNFCGTGIPIIDQIPSEVLATGNGSTYTNGTVNAVAFLNTGNCGPNGGSCTAVDLELGTQSDGSSFAIIDLIPTHEFTVPVSFSFYNGCDGSGVSCLDSTCANANRTTAVNAGLVLCGADETHASVLVQFCPGNATSTTIGPPSSSTTSSSSAPSIPTGSSTSGSNSSHSNARTSSPAGAIVGGVIGGIAALTILILLLFYLRHRSQSQKKAHRWVVPFSVDNPPPGSKANLPYDPYNNNTLPVSELTPPFTVQPNIRISPSNLSQSSLSDSGTQKTAGAGVSLAGAMSNGPESSSAPIDSSALPVSPANTEQLNTNNLDQIVDVLARRFGWTQPPSGAGVDQPPPMYQDPNMI